MMTLSKVFSCLDSLVNCILNPDLSYRDLFAYIFKWSSIDRGFEWIFSLENLGPPIAGLVSGYDNQKM